MAQYRDGFGNQCIRIIAPPGRFQIEASGVVRDAGTPDAVVPSACQHDVTDLPEETLVFLLGSLYCETDRLSEIAWQLFEYSPPGWARVQAICDFVHDRKNARATRTAWEAYNEGTGVCRDYAHLAIALCRCMNIPARYCTGYLGDMGTPEPWGVGDFAAWFEAYLGGAWQTFDPRNNVPRIGRVLIARGRDAADVAITTTFGQHTLERFQVFTDEM
jgi:transglutaminase-like putative cysteine protease